MTEKVKYVTKLPQIQNKGQNVIISMFSSFHSPAKNLINSSLREFRRLGREIPRYDKLLSNPKMKLS